MSSTQNILYTNANTIANENANENVNANASLYVNIEDLKVLISETSFKLQKYAFIYALEGLFLLIIPGSTNRQHTISSIAAAMMYIKFLNVLILRIIFYNCYLVLSKSEKSNYTSLFWYLNFIVRFFFSLNILYLFISVVMLIFLASYNNFTKDYIFPFVNFILLMLIESLNVWIFYKDVKEISYIVPIEDTLYALYVLQNA